MKTIKEVTEIYKTKGLKAVNSYLKSNNVPHKRIIHEFGLKGNKEAEREKNEFLLDIEPNKLKTHYYSIGFKAKKTGYSYNRLRALEIIINS